MRWIAGALWVCMLGAPMVAELTAGHLDMAGPGIHAAEEASAGGEEVLRQRTWGDAILAGGFVGAIIILLSIAALALVIQYTVEQKHEKLIPSHVVGELEQLFEEQAYDEAADLCQNMDCYLTRIVAAGLAKMEGGYEAIQKGIEAAGDEETVKLMSKLNNLSLIVAVGPMLGLYGTVTGMISAFNVIASTAGGASPAQLADGISEALVTTFEGLTVAIPTAIAFHFLKARLVRTAMEAGGIVDHLFERFRTPQA